MNNEGGVQHEASEVAECVDGSGHPVDDGGSSCRVDGAVELSKLRHRREHRQILSSLRACESYAGPDICPFANADPHPDG